MSTILDCPQCDGGPVIARGTRRAAGENAIRRIRECDHCGHEFITFEWPMTPETLVGASTSKKQRERV